MKEIEKTQISGRLYHTHRLEKLIMLKCPYCLKQSTGSIKFYKNTNGIFHRSRTNNPKINKGP